MAESKNTSTAEVAEATTANSNAPKTDFVTLAKKNSKDKDKGAREFSMAQANALLKLPNAQWEIGDTKHTWNGTEIAKK